MEILFVYICLFKKILLPLQSQSRIDLADILLKGVYWRLFWQTEIRKISLTQSKKAINAPWCV